MTGNIRSKANARVRTMSVRHSTITGRQLFLVRVAGVLVAVVVATIPAWTQVRGGTNAVAGIVFDSLRGSPIPSAAVFLRGTTRGTVTDSSGVYDLTNLPDGEYDLVFSMLGYQRASVPVTLRGSTQLRIDGRLEPRTIGLPQVVVTGSTGNWEQLLPVFKNIFLGTTDNADECRIVNPEVISLSIGVTGDSLQARTDSTLIVDNYALGYRVFVEIDSCIVASRGSRYAIRWFPRFKEMTPEDESQRENWRKRRAACWQYSFTHFLRSAVERRLRKDDFRVTVGDVGELIYAKGEEIDDNHIRVTQTRDPAIVAVDFGTSLMRVDRLDDFGSWKAPMEFLVHPENPLQSVAPSIPQPGPDFRARIKRGVTQPTAEGTVDRRQVPEHMEEKFSSIVRFKEKPLLVDKSGNLVRQFSVVLNGYWETRRLADSLPFDYAPQE